jgi:hypothetical protein
MASYQRIVSITDFRITRIPDTEKIGDPSRGPTVDAQFLLTAYFAPPERLQAAPPADEKKNEGRGRRRKGKEAEAQKEPEKKEAA